MHRKAIITALIAAATPAFALGQHPADSASVHPASSARGNAVTGQANATRIEACTSAASTLIKSLEKGEAQAAASDFDPKMKTSLTAAKLGAVWQQVEGKVGKLRTLGTPQNMMYQNHVIVMLPLHFEQGALAAQVACDADGKIAGFYLRPAAAPSSSAPASGD
jgi:hypothetical protein